MNWKIIFCASVVVLAALFIIPSWHNAYEDGRLDGYNQGSIDAMEYTKIRIAANISPDELSTDSYDYFKMYKKLNFYDRMWEVQPPEPDIWDVIGILQGIMMLVVIALSIAVLTLRPDVDKNE